MAPLQQPPRRTLPSPGNLIWRHSSQPLQVIDEIGFALPPKAAEIPLILGQVCRSPGCTLPASVRRNGTPSKYCMVTHMGQVLLLFFQFPFTNDGPLNSWGERGCISCRAAPMIDASVLCQPCHDTALSTAPVIIEVPEGHNTYKSGTLTTFY